MDMMWTCHHVNVPLENLSVLMWRLFCYMGKQLTISSYASYKKILWGFPFIVLE